MSASPLNTPKLEGKVAFITGAAHGIGQGIAKVLAGRGAAVCVADIDLDAARAVAGSLTGEGFQAIAAEVDVRKPPSIDEAVEQTERELGPIDVCVPNAGVIAAARFEERDGYVPEDWDVTRDINVLGVVNTLDAVVPGMKERRSGKIVIISSQGGRPPRGATLPLGSAIMPYLVSKSATIQLTHHLAIELGQFNINVNAVCPGTVWTPMWERIAQNRMSADETLREFSPRELFENALQSRHPLPREQTPEDIGNAVAFFASSDADQVTGQALNVNGGAVMS